MNNIIGAFWVVFSLLITANVWAQDSIPTNYNTHTLSLKTQFIQINDAINYGLVYSGPNVGIAYRFIKNTKNYMLSYTPEIHFGGLFNQGGGYSWRFKPIDIFYARNLRSKPIAIGAYLATDYQWQQYPELHGGRLYWFSTIEVGPKIAIRLRQKVYSLNISLSNSLAGFSSRPEFTSESYFYNFSFSEFINVAHRNLTFGHYNLFSRTKFGLGFNRDNWKRLSIGYNFEYFAHYRIPKLTFISHSINFNWKLK